MERLNYMHMYVHTYHTLKYVCARGSYIVHSGTSMHFFSPLQQDISNKSVNTWAISFLFTLYL